MPVRSARRRSRRFAPRPAGWRRWILRRGLPLAAVLALSLLRRRLAARLFGRLGQARDIGVRAADVSAHGPEAYGVIVRSGLAARLCTAAEEEWKNVPHSSLHSSPVSGLYSASERQCEGITAENLLDVSR